MKFPKGFGRAGLISAGLASAFTLAAISAAGPATAQHMHSTIYDCEIGAYRSPKGEVVALAYGNPRGFAYRFFDGRMGNTADPNPLVLCGEGSVDVKQADGRIETWPRVPLRLTQTRFQSQGTTLSGLLIEPESGPAKPPLMVYVHGSNNDGWIGGQSAGFYSMAANGVAVFAYDKRGTGQSAGVYSQDFRELARDVVAASAEARRLAAGRYGRFGLAGFSQGGWIAPLAAGDAKADFVVIGYGGIFTPLEEDAEQVFTELREKGYGADVLAKARQVTDATGAVIASHFTKGFERLAEVKRLYGAEPWFTRIKGEFTGDVLKQDEAGLRATGPATLDDLHIDWAYDSMPVLRRLSVPILWINAGSDREAPTNLTQARLATLQAEGKPILVVTFPDTDHGITEFTEAPDGSRKTTRVAEGYLRLIADWVKGQLHPPYGRAVFKEPRR